MSNDRPSALLTRTQRNLLDGEAEFTPDSSQGRSTRSRLRDRIKLGIQDFEYLADTERFDSHEVDLLLENETDRGRLLDGCRDIVAFIYRLQPQAIESIIDDGVTRGVRRFSPEYVVGDVRIPVQKRGQLLETARRQMDNGQPLTDAQIRAMLLEGEIPPKEVQEYIKDHPGQRDYQYRTRFRGP